MTWEILDAVGQFHFSPKFNVWFGRFLPPSDRDEPLRPVLRSTSGRYTATAFRMAIPSSFKAATTVQPIGATSKLGSAKIKASVGAFDGPFGGREQQPHWASRVQIDFWDPENGYYLNGTYYGDKNLLAIAGATQVQDGKTATTVGLPDGAESDERRSLQHRERIFPLQPAGGYDANYGKSQGAYGLASFLFPKPVGMGKFEVPGKYAIAEFTDRRRSDCDHELPPEHDRSELQLHHQAIRRARDEFLPGHALQRCAEK